jgi:hypothetical protein
MNLKVCKVLICIVVMFFDVTTAKAEFKVYLDESRTDYVMVERQDCSVYKAKDGIKLGFKAGNILFSVGPEITFGSESGIDWSGLTQKLIAQYMELCTRFNTGSIVKSEYDKRLKKIDSLEVEATKLYQKIITDAVKRTDQLFDELDEATSEKILTYKDSYDNINRMIDRSKF